MVSGGMNCASIQRLILSGPCKPRSGCAAVKAVDLLFEVHVCRSYYMLQLASRLRAYYMVVVHGMELDDVYI